MCETVNPPSHGTSHDTSVTFTWPPSVCFFNTTLVMVTSEGSFTHPIDILFAYADIFMCVNEFKPEEYVAVVAVVVLNQELSAELKASVAVYLLGVVKGAIEV